MYLILTLLIFAIPIIGFIIDLRIDKRFYSPVKMFNTIWIVLLGLYYLKLSYIQSDFTQRTLSIFALYILFFNLTYFLAHYVYFIKGFRIKSTKNKKTKKRTQLIKIVARRIINYPLSRKLKVINITFITLFVVEIIYSGFLPLLSLITKSGGNYLHFGIPSLNGFMYAIAICVGAYYLYKKDPHVFIYIGFGVLAVSRQVIMSIIIEAAIILICRYKKDSIHIKHLPIKIFIITAALIGGFTIFGNFRSGSTVMQDTFKPRETYKNLPSSAMWIYSYTEFSFSNFNKLTSLTYGNTNLGANSISTILPSIISKRLPFDKKFRQNYLVQSNFNVSTWFADIYIDFGIIGIVLFSVFVSLLGFILYSHVLSSQSIRHCLLYAVFIHNILLFFFVNMFLYLPVVSQFIFIPLIFKREQDDKQKTTR